LTIGFAPTTSGSASGTLTITSNASNGTFTVPLTGTGASHSVALSWTDTGGQIAGYNVYRSTVSGGPYNRINGALDGTTSYTDSNVISGTAYYYTVTAVGTSGLESAYSNQTTVTIP
jgi:fibronectin type 3 domain-containing protein